MSDPASSKAIELPGLDGASPLGFLAALGVLVVLHEAGEKSLRLGWVRRASWCPVLFGSQITERGELCSTLGTALRGRTVASDAEAVRATAQKEFEKAKTCLKKAVEAFKKRGLRGNARKLAAAAELNPIRAEFERCRTTMLQKRPAAVPRAELAIGTKIDLTGDEFRSNAYQFIASRNTSSAALLAAFATEGHKDEKAKRTDFDFVDSSGRLAFLETVQQLMMLVTAERLEASLFQTWKRRDERYSLRWDPSEDRRYALLDRDPTASDNKSRSEWMANLLGYRALSLFPCAQTRSGAATTAWSGRREGLAFTWPIWDGALSLDALRSLLQQQELVMKQPDTVILRARGIGSVYRSRRVENGDYINFSPARALL